MPLICAVRVAEGWTAGSIIAGVALAILVVGLIVLAIRVTLRR